MKVLLYIRVSKIGDRADTLISDEVQEDVCRKWAAREGLVVVGVPVTDLDKSGREMSKRQISASINRVRRGEADGIVVWKVSRWGRNLIDSMLNVRELQEAGGFIASATETLDDIETPMGRFSLTQMLAIAQLQSDQIGETWVNIHDYRRERGLPHNGGPRFGYVKNDDVGRDDDPSGVYTIDPKTGPWLRKCYEDFVAGKTITKLVFELNQSAVLTTRGGRFTSRTLLKLLDSGFGAGLIIDRRDADPNTDNPNLVQYYPGAHQAVISRTTWDDYVERRARKVAPREAAPVTRLTRLLYCAHCKRKMGIYWSSPGGTHTRSRGYECGRDRYSNQTTVLCPSPVYIRQTMAETSVQAWIESRANSKGDLADALARQRRHKRALDKADATDQTIEALTSQRTRLLDVILDEADDEADIHAQFLTKRTELNDQIDALTTRAKTLRDENSLPTVPTATEFKYLLSDWNEADTSMANKTLQDIVTRIYVHRADSKTDDLTGRLEVIGRWTNDPYCDH